MFRRRIDPCQRRVTIQVKRDVYIYSYKAYRPM